MSGPATFFLKELFVKQAALVLICAGTPRPNHVLGIGSSSSLRLSGEIASIATYEDLKPKTQILNSKSQSHTLNPNSKPQPKLLQVLMGHPPLSKVLVVAGVALSVATCLSLVVPLNRGFHFEIGASRVRIAIRG